MRRPLRQQAELILSLTKRELKARYKDSVLGFLWSLFRPAFLTLVLWIVFSKLLRLNFPVEGIPYWLNVLVSILAWNFLLGSLAEATSSIVANANLLKKVALDAEVFPIASIMANAVHFALALVVVLIVVVIAGVGLHATLLFVLPLIALEAIFILGLAFYLSALNVFYRDVGSLFELIAMAWFYVTPIIYPLSMASQELHRMIGPIGFRLYMLNPITPIIVGIRQSILYGSRQGEIAPASLLLYLGVACAVSTVVAFTGWKLFRRLAPRFADEL